MTKYQREQREFKSLFADERYAKQAWRRFMAESLESPAVDLPTFTDARGNVSPQSEIYEAAIRSVRARLEAAGLDREPMKAEVIVEANIIQAAFNTQTFNTILDRTAGKVKDEISVTSGAYEELSDEELQVLMAHRRNRELGEPDADT